MKINCLFLGLLLLLHVKAFSQAIVSGFVLEASSKNPIEGVSVFYDGTSIGTITNEAGFFELSTKKVMTANLVINHIGFELRIFDGSKTDFPDTIFLKEKPIRLDEVVLKPDTWSREKKWNIFRTEFLGKTQAALECRITNENDIRLHYKREKGILKAYADSPIKIVNSFLGYNITYNLQDFEVHFETDGSGSPFPKSTYMVGTLFFSELNKNRTRRKHLKNRRKIYLGSMLHFMRSLAEKRLQEENFKIIKDSLQVLPYSEFRINKKGTVTEVEQLSKTLFILYDDVFQSSIEVTEPILYIDEYGNHTPPQNIFFAGVMGMQRVANLLPLNYVLPKTD